MEKKPDSSGNALSASPPTTKHANVNGIALRNPRMRSSDCSAAIAEISEPADMKSSALKKACVIRWKNPPTYAAAETPMIM